MMKVNFREPSTKRGIVMTITGGIVLYQLFFGSGSADVDGILARVDWWLGIGLTLAGMLGLLPDRDPQQRTRATDQPSPLPPIELMGRSESAEKRQADPTLAALDELISGTAFYRYRDLDDELAHPSKHTEVKPEDSSGWNG